MVTLQERLTGSEDLDRGGENEWDVIASFILSFDLECWSKQILAPPSPPPPGATLCHQPRLQPLSPPLPANVQQRHSHRP